MTTVRTSGAAGGGGLRFFFRESFLTEGKKKERDRDQPGPPPPLREEGRSIVRFMVLRNTLAFLSLHLKYTQETLHPKIVSVALFGPLEIIVNIDILEIWPYLTFFRTPPVEG